MRILNRFLLGALVWGLMVLPGYAQTSSNQPSDQTAAQSGKIPNPKNSAGKYNAGKEKSDRFATGKEAKDTSEAEAMTDQQFIKYAAEDDLAEVQMAQLAQQKASGYQIKDMAQMLMKDHEKNQDQIKQLAQKMNVTLPTTLSAKKQAKLDRLKKLSGTQFDKAFTRMQLKGHEKDVKLFEKEASSAQDPAVKSYAQQTAQVLQHHLQMVQNVAQAEGIQSASNARPAPMK